MISTQARVCFVGNCQAGSLAKVARDKGIDAHYLLMCSTKIMDNGIDTARNYLKAHIPEQALSQLLKRGTIRINPSHKDFARINPDVFVYTLFHERASYYIHKKDNFIFEYTVEAISNPLYHQFLHKDNDLILFKNDYSTYLERYRQMIIKNAVLFPDAEHIIVERIKDLKFSDKSRAFLGEWHTLQNQSESLYEQLNKIKNINVLKTEEALNRCINAYGKKNIFYWRIGKLFENDNYIFYKYLDTEHPIKGYWESVIDILFNIITPLKKKDRKETIEFNRLVQSIAKGRSIAFWGAGSKGKMFLEAYKDTLNVVCIFDNDKKKQGTTLAGIPVVAPHSYEAKKLPFDTIIVTSTFLKEVLHTIAQNPIFQHVRVISSDDILNQTFFLKQASFTLVPYDRKKHSL